LAESKECAELEDLGGELVVGGERLGVPVYNFGVLTLVESGVYESELWLLLVIGMYQHRQLTSVGTVGVHCGGTGIEVLGLWVSEMGWDSFLLESGLEIRRMTWLEQISQDDSIRPRIGHVLQSSIPSLKFGRSRDIDSNFIQSEGIHYPGYF
jgi:hypothetical protein